MSNEQKVTSNEQKIMSNEPKVASNKQKVTSNKQKVMISEQEVTSNVQKVTSNEQKVTSSQRKVTSNEQKVQLPFQLKMKIFVNNICFPQKHCEKILSTKLFFHTALYKNSSRQPGAVYEILLLMKNYLALFFTSSDMPQLMNFWNASSTTNLC